MDGGRNASGTTAVSPASVFADGTPLNLYVIQPGVGTIPYKFKGVPSAKTGSGETAVVPEALRPPSMR